MAFRRRLLCRGVIVSDEGFTVFPCTYGGGFIQEGSRKLNLAADELLGGTVEFVLGPNSVWLTRNGNEPFAPGDRQRVMKSVQRALEFDGWRIDKECLERIDAQGAGVGHPLSHPG